MIKVRNNIITRLFRVEDAVRHSMQQTFYNYVPFPNFQGILQSIDEGYMANDLVYSIVSKKAKVGAKAKFGVYKVANEKALKNYNDALSHSKSLKDVIEAKESALLPTSHRLNRIYANPSDYQSETEYTESLLLQLNLTGNCYEFALKAESDGRVLELHWMPSSEIIIMSDGKFPLGIAGYKMNGVGLRRDFTKSEIVHAKYANPKWGFMGDHFYGMSPLQAAWGVLQSDTEGFSALAEQRQNRGARKIIAIENEKISEYGEGAAMMTQLADVFNNKANSEYKDRLMPIFGRAQMLDVGLTAKDMEILQSGQITFDRLCNIYGVPTEWFNSEKQSKYDNLEQYNRQAVLNGIIPDLNKIKDARNKWAREHRIIKDDEIIDFDQTCFSELDIDKQNMMGWLKDAPFTENEKRVFLGENTINDNDMDKVYIAANRVPIDMAGKITIKPEGNANEGQ